LPVQRKTVFGAYRSSGSGGNPILWRLIVNQTVEYGNPAGCARTGLRRIVPNFPGVFKSEYYQVLG
jgi:hypothetical protein